MFQMIDVCVCVCVCIIAPTLPTCDPHSYDYNSTDFCIYFLYSPDVLLINVGTNVQAINQSDMSHHVNFIETSREKNPSNGHRSVFLRDEAQPMVQWIEEVSKLVYHNQVDQHVELSVGYKLFDMIYDPNDQSFIRDAKIVL
jgi:hypothetical protein